MKDLRHYIALRDKYNSKTATPSEAAEFIELYESGIYTLAEEELEKAHWQKLANTPPTQEELDRDERMYAEFIASVEKPKVRSIFRPRRTTWFIAASVAIAAATAVGFWSYQPRETTPVVAIAPTVITGPSYVRLPDHSTVELSAGSRLTYHRQQYLSNREVSLTGTAFFDVTHDPAHTFKVRSGRVLTTVLGTSFVVSESPDLQYIDVTVVTGKVAVGALDDSVKTFRTVLPNQKLTVKTDHADKDLFFSFNERANIEAELKFKENNIVLDGVTLRDAVAVLEKRFNVHITIENERLESCLLASTFVHNESLKEVLDYICPIWEATPEITADQVIIKGGVPCDN